MIREITTVLGDSRPVTKTYGDGSVDCPYCSNAILFPKATCDNPWCEAHPSYSPEALTQFRIKKKADAERRAEDEATRKSVLESAVLRNEEHVRWQSEQTAEAKRRGACLNCLFQAGWERVKFIRHRGVCPKA